MSYPRPRPRRNPQPVGREVALLEDVFEPEELLGLYRRILDVTKGGRVGDDR
jgi:hypothetical protein